MFSGLVSHERLLFQALVAVLEEELPAATGSRAVNGVPESCEGYGTYRTRDVRHVLWSR